MKTFLRIAFFAVASVSACFAAADRSGVFVVANKNSADSLAIAQYYCKARGIAAENVVEISLPDVPALSRADYETKLANPIVDALAKRGAVSAMVAGTDAETGRRRYIFNSHNVEYVVLCALPYKVNPSAGKKGMRFDGASVDSELAATFLPQKTLGGPCRNPLYGNFSGGGTHKIYGVLRVARLDGDSFDTAKKSIDGALAVERKGLRGRAYIDKSKKYKLGDDWLDSAAKTARAMYFDTVVDEKPTLFDFSQRLDGAAIYLGWYSAHPQFYFNEKGFKLADGAIALHLFSFSASDLRKNGWTLRLLQCGAAQAFGNVFEPYLSGTQNIAYIMQGYARGLSAGEVAYASIEVLGWQSVVVGDPLYEPFKVGLEAQLAAVDAGEVDSLSQYAVLRMMNKMLADGAKSAEVSAFGEKYVGRMPDDALLFRLAADFAAAGEGGKSKKYADILLLRDFCKRADMRGLAFELAEFLSANSRADEAMKLYLRLLDSGISSYGRRAVVRSAEALAAKCGLPVPARIESYSKQFAKADAEHKKRTEANKKK